MDIYAPYVIEYYLRDLVTGLSDFTRNFYGHRDLSDEAEPEQIQRPCVIVALPAQMKALGYPVGPVMDVAYVETTEVAIYVETPYVIPNPGGSPQELDGDVAVHIPTVTAIKDWLKENKGLAVPDEVTDMGCDREEYGLWQPNPTDRPLNPRSCLGHVFHAVLQLMEVT